MSVMVTKRNKAAKIAGYKELPYEIDDIGRVVLPNWALEILGAENGNKLEVCQVGDTNVLLVRKVEKR